MALIREGKGAKQKGEHCSSSSSATASVDVHLAGSREANEIGYGSHDLGDLAGNLQASSTRECDRRVRARPDLAGAPTRNDALPIDSANQCPCPPSLHPSAQ